MKRIFLLFVFIAVKTFSQSSYYHESLAVLPFNEEKKISYDSVVDISNKPKDQIYKYAKEYIILNYVSKGAPILIDETPDRLFVKGALDVVQKKGAKKIHFNLVYTLKLYFKDNKYKYEMSDMVLERKLDAKIKTAYGTYWSTSTIKDPKILRYDIEKMYAVKRYRKQKNRLFFDVDSQCRGQLYELYKYIKKDNDKKDW